MPKKSTRSRPKYTLHRGTGQARVRINGKDHYLGEHGSADSRERYEDLMRLWFDRQARHLNSFPAFLSLQAPTAGVGKMEDQTTKSPAWHPCDDFIVPVMEAIAVASSSEPDETSLGNLGMALLKASSGTGVRWLELNVSPQYADIFSNRMGEEAREAANWSEKFFQDSFQEQQFRNQLHSRENAEIVISSLQRLSVAKWNIYCLNHLHELFRWLDELQAWLRTRVTLEGLALKPHFVPSEIQRHVLAALHGASLTADKLQNKLNIGRHALFGGKNNLGGTNELLELGLILNSKKAGGYYRPDAPPKAH